MSREYRRHGPNTEQLFEAICEGRRLDALEILADIRPDLVPRSLAHQRSLFPDRVPPITEKDTQQ